MSSNRCLVNSWVEYNISPELFEEAWNIESSGQFPISIVLGIVDDGSGDKIVGLYNGEFGGLDPVLGEFSSMIEARRFARSFMRDVCTWIDLVQYFENDDELRPLLKMIGVHGLYD